MQDLKVFRYRTCAIITRSWFETALDYKSWILVKLCLIFRFFEQWSFKKDCFLDLPTFKSTRAFYSGRYFNYDKKLHYANNICVVSISRLMYLMELWHKEKAFKMGCFSYKHTLMKLSWNPRITNCPYKSVLGQE